MAGPTTTPSNTDDNRPASALRRIGCRRDPPQGSVRDGCLEQVAVQQALELCGDVVVGVALENPGAQLHCEPYGACGVRGHGSGTADPSGAPDGSGAHCEMTRDFGVVIPATK